MKVFIWTEAFNCGEILEPMLSSYIKHNTHPIHVFGTENDLEKISIKSELIIYKTLSNQKIFFKSVEKWILSGYKKGHLGTAALWEHLINSRSESIFIHLDADTIFLADVISDLVNAIEIEGFSIAGSRRPYRNRPYRQKGKDAFMLNARVDCINTDCFAFNKRYVSKYPRFWLRRKILGKRVSIYPVVDFFDPVTFEIIRKGGKIKYMDSPNGGLFSNINKKSKFITDRISFGGVLNKFKGLRFLDDNLVSKGIFTNTKKAIKEGGDLFVAKKGVPAFIHQLKASPFKTLIKAPILYTKSNIMEGVQETGQDVIDSATKQWYMYKYGTDEQRKEQKSMNDFLYAGAKQQLTMDGLKTFMSGFLTGGIINVLGGGLNAGKSLYERTTN